jgi:pimeloyl-ACP methyl ester carboxylesterase
LLISVNNIHLEYEDHGDGRAVVMVMGSGASGRVWHLHQAPALLAAGYRVITFNNRGIPPSYESAEGFTIRDMVDDLCGLIEALNIGPCLIVATSLGAYMAQEAALARPGLIGGMVLMATSGRSDTTRQALAEADHELHTTGVVVPGTYTAVVQAMLHLSPKTLNDGGKMRDWLDLFAATSSLGDGARAQLNLAPMPDRLDAYRKITTPCHVVSFEDDLITPPHLGRELAATIPGATHTTIPGCGHYGYLEDPHAVNREIIGFFSPGGNE